MTDIRELIHERITDVIRVFDAHDASMYWGGEDRLSCACGFTGTMTEWEQHLATRIADKLTEQPNTDKELR